jgi:hypothetical protein
MQDCPKRSTLPAPQRIGAVHQLVAGTSHLGGGVPTSINPPWWKSLVCLLVPHDFGRFSCDLKKAQKSLATTTRGITIATLPN